MSKRSQRELRKIEHLQLSLDLDDGPVSTGFEDVRLVHRALPEITWQEIDISYSWSHKKLTFPLIINAITGGPRETFAINAALARAAGKTGIGMAVGSQVAALDNPSLVRSYKVVREEHPDGFLLANVSALTPWPQAEKAIAMLAADAIQLHLNVPQELMMAEGDRDFRNVKHNIATIVANSPVPVVIKEVGFGISREATTSLFGAGVRWIDVGGQGGTNFIAIESRRQPCRQVDADLCRWGMPTAVSLLENLSTGLPVHVIASGGIRSALDMAKALCLGAQLVGVAGPFLKTLVKEGEDALVAQINSWRETFQAILLMTGARNLTELRQKPCLIFGATARWLELRGIDVSRWAKR